MRRNPTPLLLWLLASGCEERIEVDDCQHLEREAESLLNATQYVTDKLLFPSSGDANTYAYDVTGRGQPRNQFAALAAQLRLHPAVEELVQRGELALVFDVRSSEPGAEGALARVRVSHAIKGPEGRVRAISPPPSQLLGSLRGGQLATTPPWEQRCSQSAQLAIQFGQEGIGMHLPIQAAHLSAAIDGDELRDGEIHGVIRKRDVDALVPAIAQISSRLINRNADLLWARVLVASLEQYDPGHPEEGSALSRDKCRRAERDCCHLRPESCRILAGEVLQSPLYEALVKPDVRAFSGEQFRLQPDAPDPDSLSFGMGFHAIRAGTPVPATCPDGVLICSFGGPGWTEAHLSGLYGTGPADVWAVGNGAEVGTLLHFDGTRWDQPSEGERRAAGLFGVSYNAVTGRAWDDVWAVGDQELVARYDGRAWSRLRRVDGSGLSFVAVFPAAASDELWILGNDARGGHVFLWKGGALTERRATALPLRALHGAAADNLWAVGEGGLALRFDGTGWREDPGLRQVAAGSFYGLWVAGRDDVYVVGRASQVRRFDGAAWSMSSLAPLRESWTLRAAFGTGPRDLWLVGDRSEGGRTHAVVLHEGGMGYEAIESLQLPTSGSSLRAVFSTRPRDLWLAGETGLLMTLRP